MPAPKTKRQKLLGSTLAGKMGRAILLAALLAAGGVVADEIPALRPYIAMLIGVLTTGVPVLAPAPEKAAPPANEPAPNQIDPGAAMKKG